MKEIPKNRGMFCDPYCMFKTGGFCIYRDEFKLLKKIILTTSEGELSACIPRIDCPPWVPKFSVRLFEWIELSKRRSIFQMPLLCRWAPQTLEQSKDTGPWVDLETAIYFYKNPMEGLADFKHMWE